MSDKFTRALTQVPSSRAEPGPAPPRTIYTYTMSIQRRESAGQGRWREIASWTLHTTETDMMGPLSCGLKDNYRIIINQEVPNPNVQAHSTPNDPHRVGDAIEQTGGTPVP